MKKMRILSLILALVMLCSAFLVACGGGEGEQAGGGAGNIIIDEESDDASKKYDAEIKNLNGHEFRFVVRNASGANLTTHEVYAEAPNGDKVNDAVYARNAQLQEKYNCTIVEDRTSKPATALKEPLTAGEYICDYAFTSVRDLRTLSQSNLCADLTNVSTIDFSKAWWDANGFYGMNIAGKTFFVNGDGCTLDDRACWIMYFNKGYVAEYTSKNLYKEVDDGNWTIDLMYEIMEGTWKDVDGDGQMTMGTDRFGYIGERGNNLFHVQACGVSLANVDKDGNWSLPDQPKDEVLTVWEALRPLLTSPHRLVSDKMAQFRDGLGTFYCCNLGTLIVAGNITFDYGILPLPKLNEEQDTYYNAVSYSQLAAYCIPTTVENAADWATNGFSSGVEQAAYFLEAFSYYSMQILTPAFYDQVVMKQAVRDDDSPRMLELALKNKIYDPVVGYNFGSIQIFSEVGSNNGKDIPGTDVNYDTLVSTYTARVGAARTALEDYQRYITTDA